MTRLWIAALGLLFLGRLAFGLLSELWPEDETQIYLMGLRYYAAGEWPYFGPDVVWTQTAIAGALQPLLVGLPFAIAPVPEAPYVLLNLLSFAALSLLAWYICRRAPSLPRWLVWGWVMSVPWTLQFSTHINNPSFVLPAAVAFFVGFFEAVPALSRGVWPPRVAFLAMGAALTWMMQIHMSWPLLLPYIAVALFARATRRMSDAVAGFGWLAAGAAVPATLLLPTYIRYGVGGSGGVASNLHVHLVPPDRLLVTLAQFLSFASLEVNRFIANDNAKRLTFVMDHWWILPLALAVLTAGFVQPVWMLVSWFRKAPGRSDWKAVRMLAAFTVMLVYASYWFVTEEPQAHAFYVVAPIAFIYAADCWTLIDRPRWRKMAALLLAGTIAFHAALAITQGPAQSLYANREVVAAALRHKEPEMFGHRRPYAPAGGPRALADPSRPYRVDDLKLDEHTVRRATGDVALWTVRVTNSNRRVAFRSLIYAATYANGEGDVIQRHEDVIKDVIQPGETRTFRIPDTIIREPFQHGTFEIRAAEALLPIR